MRQKVLNARLEENWNNGHRWYLLVAGITFTNDRSKDIVTAYQAKFLYPNGYENTTYESPNVEGQSFASNGVKLGTHEVDSVENTAN